jgi:hypothetical protein
MVGYLLIASRNPFESEELRDFYEPAKGLSHQVAR